MDIFHSLFFDYTLRTVALGTAMLGIVSGALGSFAVLRRQSLLGDAMSHAALPGVVLAFMITGLKSPSVLMIGAAIAGVIGVLVIIVINRYTRIKEDSSLGIVLSVFFGFGLLLLTMLQRNPDARQAGLDSFLFGQAATLLMRDVLTMAAFGIPALLLMLLFWKEFKLLSFDRDFGSSLGFPMQGLEILITSLLVVAIVIGLQAVGVVLMAAMVVAPAAAARQWTNQLGIMVTLAAVFGAIAGVSGALISSMGSGLSTGPVIVLCISAIVLFSLLFAPQPRPGLDLVQPAPQPQPPAQRASAQQPLPAVAAACGRRSSSQYRCPACDGRRQEGRPRQPGVASRAGPCHPA